MHGSSRSRDRERQFGGALPRASAGLNSESASSALLGRHRVGTDVPPDIFWSEKTLESRSRRDILYLCRIHAVFLDRNKVEAPLKLRDIFCACRIHAIFLGRKVEAPIEGRTHSPERRRHNQPMTGRWKTTCLIFCVRKGPPTPPMPKPYNGSHREKGRDHDEQRLNGPEWQGDVRRQASPGGRRRAKVRGN